METIDIAPKWVEIMPAILAVVRDGDEQGRKTVTAELMRLARLMDEQNERIKNANA